MTWKILGCVVGDKFQVSLRVELEENLGVLYTEKERGNINDD